MNSLQDDGMSVSEAGAKGGQARARSLTPEERSESARKAVQARWEKQREEEPTTAIPHATHTGELKIGDIAIPCFVLEGGTRVISHRGLQKSLGIGVSGGAAKTARFVSQFDDNSNPDKDLTARLSAPIEFIPPNYGRSAFGYEATVLADICEMILAARQSGTIKNRNAERIAAQCEILVRGFARVGIIALIDEATGYEDVRDRLALEAILNRFLRKELATWAKRFPDEFYKEIFRLRGWEWRGMKVNRPQCVAHYTKDLVYARMTPGLLKELEIRNPKDERGYRKGLHQQLFTDDIGHPKLERHLSNVVTIMRGYDKGEWDAMYKHVDRALPKNMSTPLLDDIED